MELTGPDRAPRLPGRLSRVQSGANILPLLSLILLSNPAALTPTIAPAVLGEFLGRFGFASTWASALITLELAGMTAASIAGALLVSRFDARMLAISALALALAGQVGTLASRSAEVIAVLRFAVGLGEGLAGVVAMSSLARMRVSDRIFALLVTTNLASSTLFFGALAIVTGTGRSASAIWASVAVLLLVGLFLPFVPPERCSHAIGEGENGEKNSLSTPRRMAGAGGLFLAAAAFGAIWPMVGEIGLEKGLSHAAVARALPMATFGGIAAGVAASWLATKLRRITILSAMSLCFAGAVALLITSAPFAPVVIAIMFLWVFIFTSYLGLLAALDTTGRLSALAGAMISLGVAVGQFLMIPLISRGYAYIAASAAVLILAASVLARTSWRSSGKA